MSKFFLCSLLLVCFLATGQSDMDLLLKKYNTRSVPYISVQELKMDMEDYIILDTRKKEEYDVSHIPGAIWMGENVSPKRMALALKEQVHNIDSLKNAPLIVYCSVGIRSEEFGERLKQVGFTNVQNLYGSIFAWKDQGYEVVNTQGKPTDSVHVFSKVWSKYLRTGIKVY